MYNKVLKKQNYEVITMCGVDFSITDGYSRMPIWDLPETNNIDGEIIDWDFSIYNAKVLQPLCNLRNSVMATDASPIAKWAITCFCVATMVLGALVVGTAEVVTRLALAIISSPIALGMIRSEHNFFRIPLFLLGGALFSSVAIYSGACAAVECFTVNRNIEGLRVDMS